MTAVDRLKANGRLCDACGQSIARFTHRNSYCRVTDRTFCGLCSRKARIGGKCSPCGAYVYGKPHVKVPGHDVVVCEACMTVDKLWPPAYSVRPSVAPRTYLVFLRTPGGEYIRSQVTDLVTAQTLAHRFTQELLHTSM